MLTSLSFQDALFGFVFALPFVGVRSYVVRLPLSIGTPLVVYYLGVVVALRGHGSYWDNYVALRLILGALCAAHIRTAWMLIRKRFFDPNAD